MGYREDAKIDIYNLHQELAKQPGLYIEYAEQYADAVAIMMRADEKLKTVKIEGKRKVDERRAELDAEVRIDPQLFGLEEGKKPTEAAISSAIVLAPSFKKVQDVVAGEIAEVTEAHIEAVRNKELLDGVKIAFSHRKVALEGEVQLFLNEYYADPKVPKPYVEAKAQETREELQEGLSRSSRLRRRKPGE